MPFIVLEGIDGSGKSSVSRKLAQMLESKGRKVILTAEPSEGEVGRLIRKGVPGMSQYGEALLFTADRAQHTYQIMEWVDDGYDVICDRYYASTLAYQSAVADGPGLDEEWLMSINAPIIREPDLTFLLDLSPEVGMARVGKRGELSRFEVPEYQMNVRSNYLKIAEERNFIVIDASGTVDEVTQRIFNKIMEK